LSTQRTPSTHSASPEHLRQLQQTELSLHRLQRTEQYTAHHIQHFERTELILHGLQHTPHLQRMPHIPLCLQRIEHDFQLAQRGSLAHYPQRTELAFHALQRTEQHTDHDSQHSYHTSHTVHYLRRLSTQRVTYSISSILYTMFLRFACGG